MNSNGTGTPGPLSQIMVLDLCLARAGPTAVRVLADFGANVIQVVRPTETGIDASLPNFDRELVHRNKRSIAIDLQTEEGRGVFYKLVKQADVVVENMRADVKYRLKVDYETLRAINPRIILGSISGFGQDGPYSTRPGVDQIAQGMGGLMSVTGPPGSGPWRVGIPISDLCAGLYLSQGIMAAIIERERSGEGQWVQTSLLEAMVAMLDFQATRWLIGGEVPPQAGNDHPTAFPMGVFPAKDGMINIAASGDRMWRDFLHAVGAEELAEDERFRTARARGSHRSELRELVEGKLREKTCEEWIELLNGVGVPCGPILSIDQVFADPQVQHLKLAQPVESPQYGTLQLIRSPVRLSRTSTSLRKSAPVAGGDTDAVLGEYGFSKEEIARLKGTGAVGRREQAALPGAAG
jgi:crotonobetainyl-CoA:carnitine CoA-transferase CaiB-like acyl-CoA transferase